MLVHSERTEAQSVGHTDGRKCLAIVSSSTAVRFIVGQDRKGKWIVNDCRRMVGGIFISEAAALRFAHREAGCHELSSSIGRTSQMLDFQM